MKYRMRALQDFEITAGIIGTFLCVLWIARLLAMSTFVADGENYYGTIFKHKASSNCLQEPRYKYLLKTDVNTWEVFV